MTSWCHPKPAGDIFAAKAFEGFFAQKKKKFGNHQVLIIRKKSINLKSSIFQRPKIEFHSVWMR